MPVNFFSFKGEFMSAAKPVELPMAPPALPAPSKTDRMIYVWLTEYVANTAGYVYQAAGVLAYNITPDKVRQCSVKSRSATRTILITSC